jgi:hypothetical protein
LEKAMAEEPVAPDPAVEPFDVQDSPGRTRAGEEEGDKSEKRDRKRGREMGR